MDAALNTLARRPLRLWLAAGLAAVAVVGAHHVLRATLRPAALWTGGILYALVLGLALFNGRKKLPFLPLARASTWLQIHVWAGWLSLLVFLLHTSWHWPHGRLEQMVGAVFVLTAASGVFGWHLSRLLPPRLTRSGEPLTYERVPEFRQAIRRQVEELVRAAEKKTESSTLGDFYLEHLSAYLDRQPYLLSPLRGGGRAHHAIMARLEAIERYLHPDERADAARLREWIEAKRNLDIQYAGQRLLRLWLFVHIPATYALLLLGAVHGWIAFSYSGAP